MEEMADMAVQELRMFIDTEGRVLHEEHDLLSKLLSWDYIVAHLDERIPSEMTHLHELNGNITEKLVEIRDTIETGRMKDLQFVKEEKAIAAKLQQDVKHRDWVAVRRDTDAKDQEEKKVVRLRFEELKALHRLFQELLHMIDKHSIMQAIEKDVHTPKEKAQYAKLEEYYFLQIYKFILAYERILHHLWEKEVMLAKK